MPDRHLWTRHSQKTITFTGAAGGGAAGTVTVFTLTGRVIVHYVTAYCTADLTTTGAATIEFGVTADTDTFIVQTVATAIDVDEWWGDATPAAGSVVVSIPASTVDGIGSAQSFKTLSTNPLLTIGTADVNGGSIVFDIFYTPLTDGARLA